MPSQLIDNQGISFVCAKSFKWRDTEYEMGDDFPRRHHVALLRHNLDNAAGDLRGDVDLGGFKAAVDAHDALG